MEKNDPQPSPAAPARASGQAKRPYRSPVLEEYGSIRGLTLATGGTGVDGFGKNPMQMQMG